MKKKICSNFKLHDRKKERWMEKREKSWKDGKRERGWDDGWVS